MNKSLNAQDLLLQTRIHSLNQSIQASSGSSSFSIVVRKFTNTSAPTLYVPTPGMKFVQVEVGGGGGGGACSCSAGSGGGGGGYSTVVLSSSQISAAGSVWITVGSGGAGGSIVDYLSRTMTAALSGTSSAFGSFVSTGGGGAAVVGGSGGSGGQGSGPVSAVFFPGQAGQDGYTEGSFSNSINWPGYGGNSGFCAAGPAPQARPASAGFRSLVPMAIVLELEDRVASH